jgi:hypothetical protein
VKASVVTTNGRAPGGQFVLHARALPGNPYDGHTLRGIIEDTQKLTGREARLCRQGVPRPRCGKPAPPGMKDVFVIAEDHDSRH